MLELFAGVALLLMSVGPFGVTLAVGLMLFLGLAIGVAIPRSSRVI